MSTRTRLFVSFDFDEDEILKVLIVGQAKLADSPFEIEDHSMKEAAPQANWEAEARARIARSDKVLVMVGPKTYKAPGVLKEIKMAQQLGKPIFQVIGYKDASPTLVPGAGQLYKWEWETLKRLLRKA